ncbi:MAG: type II toxin-antitoxin system HicA family toxin [Methylobacter sp.]
MKRRNFIRELVEAGCYLKRHGNKHDIYANPINGRQTPIPRHSEILKFI